MARSFARAPKGERVYALRPGKRYKRLNIIAGQIGNEVIAPCSYEWSTNSQWFEVWFEWYFCLKLPSSCLIIMDNARFHRKIELEKIAKFYGFRPTLPTKIVSKSFGRTSKIGSVLMHIFILQFRTQ
jgi:hypothetical protein